jgi:hypothetical protein
VRPVVVLLPFALNFNLVIVNPTNIDAFFQLTVQSGNATLTSMKKLDSISQPNIQELFFSAVDCELGVADPPNSLLAFYY